MIVSDFNFILGKSLITALILMSVTFFSLPYLLQKSYILLRDVNIILVILFYWSLFTSLWSEYPLETLQRVFMIYIPIFIIFVLVAADRNKTKTFFKVSNILCISLSIISGIAIILRLFGDVQYSGGRRIEKLTLGPFNIFQELHGIPPFFRVTSITNNPNTLALWLVISLTLCVCLYYSGNISLKVFVVHFILQFLGIALTMSRAGIASAFISLFLIYVMAKKRRIIYVFFLLSVIVMIVGFLIFDGWKFSFSDSYSQLRISTDLNSRQDAWIPLIKYIVQNPLLGCGFGVSSEAILQKQQLDIAAHNVYLMIFSEIGLLGGSLFLLFWLFSIAKAFFLYRNSKKTLASKQEYYSILASFSLQVSLIFHQFFEGKLMRLDFVNFIWIYLIVYISELYRLRKGELVNEKSKTNPPHHRSQHRWCGNDVV
jgi:O-antigen ligase